MSDTQHQSPEWHAAKAATVDTGYAPERWAFDKEVTRVFDDMLERSIPQYETMREAVTLTALEFLVDGSVVIDLGCSRGESIARLLRFGPGCTFVGLEASEHMCGAAAVRFEREANVLIYEHDLRFGLDSIARGGACSVILSVLTMMFVPVEYRARILADVYDALLPGGAFIMVEKTLGEGRRIDELFSRAYRQKKYVSGYTEEEVERKRLSLEGVLVPHTASFNHALLTQAGFRDIDRFWSWMNFSGFIALK